jgi:hypothetical protein
MGFNRRWKISAGRLPRKKQLVAARLMPKSWRMPNA